MSDTARCFHVGQMVEVAPRTWAGINKPGGVCVVEQIHFSNGYIDCLDVKYVITKQTEARIDTDFLSPYEYLDRRSRKRKVLVQKQPETAVARKKRTQRSEQEPPLLPEPLSDVTVLSQPVTKKQDQEERPLEAIEVNNHVEQHSVSPLPSPEVSRVVLADLQKGKSASSSKNQKTKQSSSRTKKPKTKKKVVPSASKSKPPNTKALKSKKAAPKTARSTVALRLTESSLPNKTTTTSKLLAPRLSKEALPTGSSAPTERVPFQKVYDKERKSAEQFVNVLLADKSTKKLVVGGAKQKKPGEEETMNASRRECFVSVFSEFLRRQDGQVYADHVLHQVNQMLKDASPFSQEEVQVGLQYLSDCDKIMQCDDKIYSLW